MDYQSPDTLLIVAGILAILIVASLVLSSLQKKKTSNVKKLRKYADEIHFIKGHPFYVVTRSKGAFRDVYYHGPHHQVGRLTESEFYNLMQQNKLPRDLSPNPKFVSGHCTS